MTDEDDDKFWESPNEHSKVKIKIVSKYFEAWARIIGPRTNKMYYLDLYAGRGAYADGHPSTPVNILTFAVQNEHTKRKLESYFNDSSLRSAQILRQNISSIPNIDALAFKPRIFSSSVDDEFADRAQQIKLQSSFIFVDPFGGKGVSLSLLHSLLKPEKTDGFLFFNYNRNNMWLKNPNVEHIMRGLFGSSRYDQLCAKVDSLPSESTPDVREQLMIEVFRDALNEEISAHTVPFKMVTEGKIYYLFGISKNRTAFRIMKDVMGKESTAAPQGVPAFEWNPVEHQEKSLLYQFLQTPLTDLINQLPSDLAGKSLTPEEMLWVHGRRNNYTCANYRDACIQLVETGQIDATNLGKTGKVTFESRLKFPKVPR